jgi:hypothetical protein
MSRIRIFISFLLFLAAAPCFSQRVKPLNLPSYDKEKLHLGFSLAVNKSDFALEPATDATRPY